MASVQLFVEPAEYTVSELARAVRRVVEEGFGRVRVRGELSGLRRAGSGHLYFTLKDREAVLEVVCWRHAVRWDFEPEDGLEVVATGRLTTYPLRSRYQLVLEAIEPAGLGALMAMLEERRRRLKAEGLFDSARKRPLPFLPEVIGIVTSPTGAVIRDMLHRIADRFPRRVLLWPVPVQGDGAAERIAAAIRGFGRLAADGPLPRPDVIVVARGGGSIEDLWAFNEEVVVRAAAASPIPLVSAVGHETDTTLIDHAADLRAPTPTAAAELVVPVRRELYRRLTGLGERADHALQRRLEALAHRLRAAVRGLPDPHRELALAVQRLDDLAERLAHRTPERVLAERARDLARHGHGLEMRTRQHLERAAERLAAVSARLAPALLRRPVAEAGRALLREGRRLAAAFEGRLAREETRLAGLGRALESLSHRRVLERGYALVRRLPDRRLVPRRAAAEGVRAFAVEFADGELELVRAGGRRRARGGETADPQPRLFPHGGEG